MRTQQLWLKQWLLKSPVGPFARAGWLRLKHAGLARYCPVCRSHVRRFLAHGVVQRANAVCPICQARERHRLAWLWLSNETRLSIDKLDFLHIAPEPSLTKRLSAMPNLYYVSGDLVHRATVRMDICRIPFSDSSFDMIFCSHVLNMLPDDRPAMSELARVLKPGGTCVIQVPVSSGPGIRVGAMSTPQDRLALHGDPFIFRRYGAEELKEALSQAGFDITAVPYFRHFSVSQQQRLGLIDEDLQICRKPT